MLHRLLLQRVARTQGGGSSGESNGRGGRLERFTISRWMEKHRGKTIIIIIETNRLLVRIGNIWDDRPSSCKISGHARNARTGTFPTHATWSRNFSLPLPTPSNHHHPVSVSNLRPTIRIRPGNNTTVITISAIPYHPPHPTTCARSSRTWMDDREK